MDYFLITLFDPENKVKSVSLEDIEMLWEELNVRLFYRAYVIISCVKNINKELGDSFFFLNK